MIVAYWGFSQSYYSKEGKPTKELASFHEALAPVRDLYASTPASEFGSKSLQAVRQHMIDVQKLSRKVITDTIDQPKPLRLLFEAPLYLTFPDLTYPALGDSDHGPLRGAWPELVGFHRYRDPKLAWLLQRDMAVGAANTGRVGAVAWDCSTTTASNIATTTCG